MECLPKAKVVLGSFFIVSRGYDIACTSKISLGKGKIIVKNEVKIVKNPKAREESATTNHHHHHFFIFLNKWKEDSSSTHSFLFGWAAGRCFPQELIKISKEVPVITIKQS
jgi:hypothetical protein